MANAELAQPFIGLQAARMPFLRFERRAVERRREDGALYYVDVDYAMVTAQGSRDTVDKVVAEWFPVIRQLSAEGNYPPGWCARIEEMYGIWKKTNQDPVSGTPLKNWPAISPAEYKILVNAGVQSIEDLANANEEFVGRIGMGARRLKQIATDWIEASKGTGPLVAQMDSLRVLVDGMKTQMEDLRAENKQLRKEAQRIVAEPILAQFPIGGLEERVAARRQDAGEEDLVASVLEEELH